MRVDKLVNQATDTVSAPSSAGVLEMRGIRKSFSGVHALDGASIRIEPGSVHALCGANGAGKSTLIKILAGLEKADEGEILLDGAPIHVAGPKQATAHGLNFIHQELNLVPKFSVLRNMAMGSQNPGKWGVLSMGRLRSEAREVLGRLGCELDLDTEVERLSVSDRWMVSLGRSLMTPARFIAMDEPTASFTTQEAHRVIQVVNELTADGVGVLYVSHRLDEVIAISEEITVFRNGRVVQTMDARSTDRDALTIAIVGREVASLVAREQEADHEVDRTVRLAVDGLGRAPRVQDVSFQIHPGEILGFAGLVGAGRTELARMLVGADRPAAGSMTLDGQPYAPRSPHDAIRAGVALVPEERRSQGLVLTASVEDNLAMAEHGASPGLFRRFKPKRSRQEAGSLVGRFGIKTRSPRDAVHHLSGGNQQKVVVGKYVRTDPTILILDEPTVGVDVGARAEIYGIITDLAQQGRSIVVISSDFEELAICDRVLVMRAGRIVAEIPADEFDEDRLTTLSFGAPQPEA